MKNRFLLFLLVILATVMVSGVEAKSVKTSVGVSAQVVPKCSTAHLDDGFKFQVSCTKGSLYRVELDKQLIDIRTNDLPYSISYHQMAKLNTDDHTVTINF